MPNIYLKVTIEKKWHTKNSNFLSLKFDLEVYFLGALTHADIEFSNILLHLKKQRSGGGGETVCDFAFIFILEGIILF